MINDLYISHNFKINDLKIVAIYYMIFNLNHSFFFTVAKEETATLSTFFKIKLNFKSINNLLHFRLNEALNFSN